jgi:hypothetical protein
VLAQLARGTMRGKIAQLEEALDCSFLTSEHTAVLRMMLTTINYHTAQIEELTARIEVLAQPYLQQIGQMDAVHSTGRTSAQDVIAEVGADMTVYSRRLRLHLRLRRCIRGRPHGDPAPERLALVRRALRRRAGQARVNGHHRRLRWRPAARRLPAPLASWPVPRPSCCGLPVSARFWPEAGDPVSGPERRSSAMAADS